MTTTETSPMIVPDFGDDAEQRKMAFVCSKGTLDMAYPALIMASGALEQGVETHIFFTFWGMDMINKETTGHLKFTPVGNTTATRQAHMPMIFTAFPGVASLATNQMKKTLDELNIPDVPTFLEHLSDMGCHSKDLRSRRRPLTLQLGHRGVHILNAATSDRHVCPGR